MFSIMKFRLYKMFKPKYCERRLQGFKYRKVKESLTSVMFGCKQHVFIKYYLESSLQTVKTLNSYYGGRNTKLALGIIVPSFVL